MAKTELEQPIKAEYVRESARLYFGFDNETFLTLYSEGYTDDKDSVVVTRFARALHRRGEILKIFADSGCYGQNNEWRHPYPYADLNPWEVAERGLASTSTEQTNDN
jgi:hypothetical protein